MPSFLYECLYLLNFQEVSISAVFDGGFTWNNTFSRVRKISKRDYYRRHVCLSTWNNSAPTGRLFMKFDIWILFEICRENLSLIKVWQEWRANYMKSIVLQFLSYLAQFLE
jgi:hypothetical protein